LTDAGNQTHQGTVIGAVAQPAQPGQRDGDRTVLVVEGEPPARDGASPVCGLVPVEDRGEQLLRRQCRDVQVRVGDGQQRGGHDEQRPGEVLGVQVRRRHRLRAEQGGEPPSRRGKQPTAVKLSLPGPEPDQLRPPQ
jgi:hypothetical protein